MYAIVNEGGKQYTVKKGDKLLVNKINKTAGDEYVIDQVLFINKSGKGIVGKPVVDGAKIVTEVIRQTRGPRLIVFKKRSKKGYQKTSGHRDFLTEIVVKEIVAPA
jgi:large subunit ribosomal protein L21